VRGATAWDTVSVMAGEGDLYEQLVDTANAIFGAHEHRRAFHAKGFFAEGTFTATPEAARLSRAAHFQGDPVPALIRFSNGGGNPEGHDAQREARGMAVKLRPEGGRDTDILATNIPTFAVRTPEEFLELLRLRVPDPETGQPDMEKLGAFLAEHPESQTAIQATLGSEPPASFATLAHYSPHTFYLVNEEGERTPVRYRWRPEAGEQTIPDDEARERGRDYLREELSQRLREGPVGFDLLLQVAGEGDALDDSTAIWPDERELVGAGRLEVSDLVDDPEVGDHIEVFDPARVIDGVELSDDPVLQARPRAYSVSAYRRLGVEVPNPSVPPATE
jgi:catalase